MVLREVRAEEDERVRGARDVVLRPLLLLVRWGCLRWRCFDGGAARGENNAGVARRAIHTDNTVSGRCQRRPAAAGSSSRARRSPSLVVVEVQVQKGAERANNGNCLTRAVFARPYPQHNSVFCLALLYRRPCLANKEQQWRVHYVRLVCMVVTVRTAHYLSR